MINHKWVLLHQRELFQPSYKGNTGQFDGETIPCGVYDDDEQAKRAAESITSGTIYEPWRLKHGIDGTPRWICYYENDVLICRWTVVKTPVNDCTLSYEVNYD